ncbi:MAG: hypothetical protein AB7P02_28825 [Alphaproteobacteria bacterium]
MRFRALADFASAETRSQYVAGLTYTVGPADTALATLVDRWLAEGNVERVDRPAAAISGRG